MTTSKKNAFTLLRNASKKFRKACKRIENGNGGFFDVWWNTRKKSQRNRFSTFES